MQKSLVIAIMLVAAVATVTSGAIYILANQPTESQTDQSITLGESPPSGMPGLETRPANQTDGPDGPAL